MTEDRRDPRKPRGRPRAAPHSSLSTWLSTDLHDALIRRANEREESVSKTVRDLLTATINRQK